MPLTININGLTLVHRGSMGVATATLPDVCKTPSAGGPLPVPYPNVAMSKDLMKGTTSVSVDGGNMAANNGSELMLSTGDEAGVAGGVVSSTFIKEATWMLYSFDVQLEGQGACRLTDKMFMNHMNTVCLGGILQGGFIEKFLKKNRNKSPDDVCKALFEAIMDLVDGGGRQGEGRGLDGPEGRFDQNTNGGGLGPRGAPNAPRNHGPLPPLYPDGANDWETHDNEIKKQQEDLKKKLDEFDQTCGGGSRKQQKDIGRAREVAERKRPQKQDWKGPQWVDPVPEPLLSPTTKLVIVGILGGVLIGVGIALALPTGGTSLGATAAGMALLGGAAGAGAAVVVAGPGATSPAPDGA